MTNTLAGEVTAASAMSWWYVVAAAEPTEGWVKRIIHLTERYITLEPGLILHWDQVLEGGWCTNCRKHQQIDFCSQKEPSQRGPPRINGARHAGPCTDTPWPGGRSLDTENNVG